MTLVLKLYCNLRYGTAFACEPLVSDPPYDIEDILARYPESQVENDMQKMPPEVKTAAMVQMMRASYFSSSAPMMGEKITSAK